MEEAAPSGGYAARLSVAYPDRDLNRVTTAFRIFTVIPIAILLTSIGTYGGAGILFFPVLLMVLFRQKYPRWWFDWNLNLTRFSYRVLVYLALMDDTYPSTDEEQAVRIELDYPDAERDLNRWMPLVKWLLAIPHVLVVVVLGIAAAFAVVGAWFAILFTGRYPRGIFDFVEGVMRWGFRVSAYALLLVTDEYPPFRLGP